MPKKKMKVTAHDAQTPQPTHTARAVRAPRKADTAHTAAPELVVRRVVHHQWFSALRQDLIAARVVSLDWGRDMPRKTTLTCSTDAGCRVWKSDAPFNCEVGTLGRDPGRDGDAHSPLSLCLSASQIPKKTFIYAAPLHEIERIDRPCARNYRSPSLHARVVRRGVVDNTDPNSEGAFPVGVTVPVGGPEGMFIIPAAGPCTARDPFPAHFAFLEPGVVFSLRSLALLVIHVCRVHAAAETVRIPRCPSQRTLYLSWFTNKKTGKTRSTHPTQFAECLRAYAPRDTTRTLAKLSGLRAAYSDELLGFGACSQWPQRDERVQHVQRELAVSILKLKDMLAPSKRGDSKGVAGELPVATGIWVACGATVPSFPPTKPYASEEDVRQLTASCASLLRALIDVAGGRVAELAGSSQEQGILFSWVTLYIGENPMNSFHTDRDASEYGLICPILL